MGKLEKAIQYLNVSEAASQTAGVGVPDARALLVTSLLYIGLVLSVPLENPAMLLLYALYPIVGAPLCGISFGRLLLKSLWVVPIVALIAFFNPIIDTATAFTAGTLKVSHGLLTFFSILLRALLSMQALLLLISACGFTGMCRAMRRLGVPAFLSVQLLFVFRYMRVLLEEALTMKRAREARSYGNRRLSMNMWGAMIGQLFMRTLARSQRIYMAMQARGFDGQIPSYTAYSRRWSLADTLWTAIWGALLIALRCIDPAAMFSFLNIT